ncbi:EamA family transporter [Clostridium sp. SHJSY1]|uniref:EamA family transporter n=1 Tax=Clostridium sp. SHJSY1 TaxID=2942483 RepID=UPI0028754F24|nr:EamA family transporter [Clostridium sp. SHJSY1]MDS0525582.1 EamA family transporter [Clostridium sp. SHJSY1]
MGSYILFAIYLILSVSGLFLFKLGCEKDFLVSVTTGIFSLKISFLSIIGLMCYACSFLLYMFLVSKSDMTYLVPMSTAFTQVLTIIFGAMILKETITVSKVLGTVMILIGVVIMNIKK